MSSTLNDIFSELLCMEKITVSDISFTSYNSLRVSLLRKFKRHTTVSANLGLHDYEGLYLYCKHDADSSTATFQLKDVATKVRRQLEYNVSKL